MSKSRIINTIRILNLYAGIGGNVYLLDRDKYEITSVENNPDIADIYRLINPNDKLIIGDAMEYLLENFREFDLIWASPPCQSHSRLRNSQRKADYQKPLFIDMSLWQLILFGYSYLNDKGIAWIVENVDPWYSKQMRYPFQKFGRHCYWSSFGLRNIQKQPYSNKKNIGYQGWNELVEFHNIDIPDKSYFIKVNPKHPEQILRNCVHPIEGKKVIEQAFDTVSLEDWL